MLPEPPYYAVIFSSTMQAAPGSGYEEAAEAMLTLARTMPGYLGFESARDSGLGITVSYWDSLEAIAAWRDNAEHAAVRSRGRAQWYEHFDLRIAKVERQYSWTKRKHD